MREPSFQKKKLNSGFTLIEILVVIGIITIIGSVSIIMGVDDYRRQLFRSDRDMLVTALQHARAQALSNICLGDNCADGKPHGVYIGDDEYVIFQGSCYASPCTRDSDDVAVDAVIDADPGVVQGGVREVVFKQLSGDVSTPGDIVLTDSLGRVSTTTVGSEGQIFWTH